MAYLAFEGIQEHSLLMPDAIQDQLRSLKRHDLMAVA